MPPNTPGIDIVIPIVVGKKGNGPVTMAVENVGAIVVQAKRYSEYLKVSDLKSIHKGIRDSKALFEAGIPILLGILMNVGRGGLGSEHSNSQVKFSNENVYTKSSFPIITTSAKHVQDALSLTPPIRHDLDEVVGINPGAIGSIRRAYSRISPTIEEIQATARHIHPQTSARLPSDSKEPLHHHHQHHS